MRWILASLVLVALLGLATFLYNGSSDGVDSSVTHGAPAESSHDFADKSAAPSHDTKPMTERSDGETAEAGGLCDPKVKALGTRQEVLDYLGQPYLVDASGNRWTYNNLIIHFRGDRVVALVKSNANRSAAVLKSNEPAPDVDRVVRQVRPTHVNATVSTNRTRSRVVYADAMGRPAKGPVVYGSTPLSTWHNAYHSRNYEGAWKVTHTEYGRRPITR